MTPTKVIVKDVNTSVDYIKEVYIPVPRYELGCSVSFRIPHSGSELDDGIITGYEIFVKDDYKINEITFEIVYEIDYGTHSLVDSDILYSFPENKKVNISDKA